MKKLPRQICTIILHVILIHVHFPSYCVNHSISFEEPLPVQNANDLEFSLLSTMHVAKVIDLLKTAVMTWQVEYHTVGRTQLHVSLHPQVLGNASC